MSATVSQIVPIVDVTCFIPGDSARYLESVSVCEPSLYGTSADARFCRKARIEWIMNLGRNLGGPEKAQAMIKGQGVSLILKSLSIKFKRPVTYPDTVRNLIIPRFFAK
jgi:hypothetical protein